MHLDAKRPAWGIARKGVQLPGLNILRHAGLLWGMVGMAYCYQECVS